MKPTVKEFFDKSTWTLTYVVHDPQTKDAVVIDPVWDFSLWQISTFTLTGLVPTSRKKESHYDKKYSSVGKRGSHCRWGFFDVPSFLGTGQLLVPAWRGTSTNRSIRLVPPLRPSWH
jgi:hypothetical protein